MTQSTSLLAKEAQFKTLMRDRYMTQVINYLGSEKKGLRFLSGVVSAIQRNPKLLECTESSLMNSFMTMAQLDLMPSDVSGEAYVIPYSNSKNIDNKWVKVMEAQFQLGYQGLVTLFYRAGVKRIVSEIVYENDEFHYTNGEVFHRPDVFADDRGKPKGAYVIIELGTGGVVSKVMSAKDILAMGQRFSKSFNSKDTPWKVENDPNLWMWRKTVLKQSAKLVPKNDRLITAIGEDNKDSTIEESRDMRESLKLGSIEVPPNPSSYDKNDQTPQETNSATDEEAQTTDQQKAEIEAFLDGKIDTKASARANGGAKDDGLSA